MQRNEHGIAVPSEDNPMPWEFDEHGYLMDGNGLPVTDDNGLYYSDDSEAYVQHAARYHPKLADIVRRLVDWGNDVGGDDVSDIARDAVGVWAEMREDG
jgi:hypothetical protein